METVADQVTYLSLEHLGTVVLAVVEVVVEEMLVRGIAFCVSHE